MCGRVLVHVYVCLCYKLDVSSVDIMVFYTFTLQFGESALIAASRSGHLPVVHLLIEKGADVNTQDGVCH